MRLLRAGRLQVFFRLKVFKLGWLRHMTTPQARTPIRPAGEVLLMRTLGILPPEKPPRPSRLLYTAVYLGQIEIRINAGR